MASSCSPPPPPLVLLLLAVVIFTAVSLPSIRSSARPSFGVETIPLSASMDEMSERVDGRLVVIRGGRDSAREVPTGPNPLHHNQNPITKPRKDHIVAHP